MAPTPQVTGTVLLSLSESSGRLSLSIHTLKRTEKDLDQAQKSNKKMTACIDRKILEENVERKLSLIITAKEDLCPCPTGIRLDEKPRKRPVRVAGNSTEYVQEAGLLQSFIAEMKQGWV